MLLWKQNGTHTHSMDRNRVTERYNTYITYKQIRFETERMTLSHQQYAYMCVYMYVCIISQSNTTFYLVITIKR